MRFPADENEAIEMVRYAIDHGVNYLDSAYIYKNSEVTVGKALKGGYRDRIYMATKSPIWNIEKHDDFEKYLDEELVRLGTDYVDVYLLHNLFVGHWEKVRRYDGLTFLDKMVQKGKIRYKGFSIHGTTQALLRLWTPFRGICARFSSTSSTSTVRWAWRVCSTPRKRPGGRNHGALAGRPSAEQRPAGGRPSD
jgi:predicted aldo/keto reductase-like oxidoreductase